jgi:carbon starvation protein
VVRDRLRLLAAVLPVWLLLAPRDYLSTFLKLGTSRCSRRDPVFIADEIKMPALTQFIDGTGPIFAGTLFPFVFITIACGAISGFHALVASAPRRSCSPNEEDEPHDRLRRHGLESFVAIMAMIAATVLDPGVYFAINSPAGVVGKPRRRRRRDDHAWGFPVTVEQMETLAARWARARCSAAPAARRRWRSAWPHLQQRVRRHLLALWYHFAIMFEACSS